MTLDFALDSAFPDSGTEAGEARDVAMLDALAERGWCAVDDFLPAILVGELREALLTRWSEGQFRAAGVGRGEAWEVRAEVRTDQVRWLDPDAAGPAERRYFAAMASVRQAVNRALYMGLADFEAHMAVFPPGTYYRKHLDQFRGVGTRALSAVLYLNPDWTPDDGGQLRLYTDPGDPDHYDEVVPVGGRLVLFLSARFLHEVMPAQRERLSLTGWFRTREVHGV